jgi:preprotein translocase subunit YajC
MSNLLLLLIIAAVAWILLVRPRRKAIHQTEQMLAGLRVGDEVITAGGIYGEITRLDEEAVTVEIAPELTVKVARRAIAHVVQPEEAEAEAEAEYEELEEGEPEEPDAPPDEAGSRAGERG